MTRGCLPAYDELGRKNDEIASNVGDEEAAEPEEADDVHASCDHTQYKRQ